MITEVCESEDRQESQEWAMVFIVSIRWRVYNREYMLTTTASRWLGNGIKVQGIKLAIAIKEPPPLDSPSLQKIENPTGRISFWQTWSESQVSEIQVKYFE